MITKETSRRLDPEKLVDERAGPSPTTKDRQRSRSGSWPQQHDVTPMALYRHFKDKDDLLAALGDRLLADVVLPEPTDEPWDVQLQALLGAFVTALRRTRGWRT